MTATSLGHTWYDEQIYNGYDAMTTTAGLSKCGVDKLADRGVVGRGVLIDMARHRGKDSLASGETFGVDDLEAAAAQGVTIEPHDNLLVRTGWLKVFYDQGIEAFYGEKFVEPGLCFSAELVEWFHAKEIVSLSTDTIANEVTYDPDTGIIPDSPVRTVITTSELDLAGDGASPLLAGVTRSRAAGTLDLMDLVARHDGQRPTPVSFGPDDVAFLTYTSGTTGPPKGAMNSHGNVVFNAQTYRDWVHLDESDVCLAIAPLFHITGLVAHIAVSILVPIPMVLSYRFEAGAVLELIERHRTSFVVGSITVFIALMNDSASGTRDVSSMSKIYSGGAPISPATVEAFERQFGHYIHNIYGLTETTSPSHGVPFSRRAPVDPNSGALSVGVPTFNTLVRVVDEAGAELPSGEIGEFVTSGPQVVSGYWRKPEETEHAIPGGHLHTGDVGFMDAEGWFYVVDHKKDMINAAGYKVWPRDAEDVLYGHPAVREAAVIGVPDEYRGETVKAFVSLKPDQRAEPAELIAFCKERMAAYKYPREVEIIDELPKTVTGKILRRELPTRQP